MKTRKSMNIILCRILYKMSIVLIYYIYVLCNWIYPPKYLQSHGTAAEARGASRMLPFCTLDGISQSSVAGRAAGFGRLFPKEPMFFECFDHSSIIIEAEGGR